MFVDWDRERQRGDYRAVSYRGPTVCRTLCWMICIRAQQTGLWASHPAVFFGTVLWEHGQCKIAHIVYFCFLVAGLIGFYNV